MIVGLCLTYLFWEAVLAGLDHWLENVEEVLTWVE